MTSDERELVRRFQRGEDGAFERLYAAYGASVYRFCNRICGHAADAEDLAQEVFVAAYQGIERFEGRSTPTTWLYRIALYRWRAMRCKAQETTELDEASGASPDPAKAEIARMSLESAIARLTDAQREAFVLVKAEGFTYREAAQVIGIPQGTVQSRVYDAVHRLRTMLAEESNTQGEEEAKHAMP